ncbi:MAG: hypothetical protein AB1490_07535 [Pseudomonadota bacterium]
MVVNSATVIRRLARASSHCVWRKAVSAPMR